MANDFYSRSTQGTIFPYEDARPRLEGYEFYQQLFEGDHFEAFASKTKGSRYMEELSRIKFVVANYAGLISRVCADLLFSEAPIVRVKNAQNQKFIDALMFENKLEIQNYESALSNSSLGDAIYKLRIGKRQPSDEKETIIIEDNIPHVYFPEIDSNNVRDIPKRQELAFKIKIGDKDYLRKEIHEIGSIRNELWLLDNGVLKYQVPLSLIDEDLEEYQDTLVNRSMVYHVPNWKVGRRFFGYSDYSDLGSLFFALDNRFTKIQNILDNHSDPILAVPEGILDEQGRVRREYLKMVEMPPSSGGERPQKPEYVVWDASLESAFKEIDKLIEILFMTSETSPDILGMGQGQSDSGRALKLKTMRTIAKVHRKRLYYDRALKDVLYTAQLLSQAWGIDIDGHRASGEAEVPEIVWLDGMPMSSESIDDEIKRIDAGLALTQDSLMRLDNLTEDQAKAKAEEIAKEKSVPMPQGTPSADIERF